MLRRYKFINLIILLLFLSNISLAQDKRGIGIFPFNNLTNQKKHDWISFGIDYVLSNKLSNISSYYVPSQKVIKKAMTESGHQSGKINGETVYHVGKAAGINIGITGNYYTNGKNLTVNVNFINAFNGASIFSKEYKNNLKDLFTVTDDIVSNIIDISTVTISQNEQNIIDRQLTNSIKAFENFCNGYMENEKSSRQQEIVIGLFRNALREDPNFWEASYNLGIAYFNDRDYKKALEQFDRIINAFPDFEKPYYGRALIHYRQNNYSKAKSDFKKVIKFNPNDYKPYFYLGKLSIKLKQYKQAQKHLTKASQINPDDSQIYYEMGNIYFKQKKYRSGISHFKKAVELDPDDLKALQKLGECYYRTQVYYSAYTHFQKILEIEPNNAEANFMLGITAYKQAVLSELIEAFLELFDVDLARDESSKKNLSGTRKERQEVHREMVISFGRARKGRKNFLEATFNLALTYHNMNKLDSARIYYQKTIEIKPDLVKAHIKLAKVYDAETKKVLALAEYKKVITIDPSYFVAHPTLGPEHNYINIMTITLRELDTNLKHDPNDLPSNQTMAKIYYAQGFYGKAANIYRKILKIKPNDNEAKKMLAKLEKH